MRTLAAIIVFVGACTAFPAHRSGPLGGQGTPANAGLLSRHYREGERLSYRIKGIYNEHGSTQTYEAQADGVVKKDAAGHCYEEYEWSHVIWNGKAVPVAPDFRQVLSLDLGSRPQVPDLQRAGAALVGPTLDLFTFYVDLEMAIRHGLNHVGDHVYVKFGRPSSWAAGQDQILGESSVDFDLTLQAIDRSAKTVTLLVRHVPPAQPQVQLPAAWMRTAIAGAANNWVSVRKGPNGKYVAGVGKEMFEDIIRISLTDGRILCATMDNPVQVSERECEDAALTVCGPPTRYQIRRQMAIQ